MTNANYENIGYSLCNELHADDERQSVWEQQRNERGFDSTELWNLDVTIAKFLAPRLKAARASYALEEEIMDKIIFAFEHIASDEYYSGPLPDGVAEGIQLFADNYFRLWN